MSGACDSGTAPSDGSWGGDERRGTICVAVVRSGVGDGDGDGKGDGGDERGVLVVESMSTALQRNEVAIT